MKKLFAIAFTILAVAAGSFAAAPASDNAADAAYSGGWTNGSNGGTGFGAWALNPTSNGSDSGHFIGDSSLNGSGTSGDINTSGASFGMYSKNSNISEAIRPFTGALAVGDTFTVDLDNGFLTGTSAQGIGLRAGGANEFEIFFRSGGPGNYEINDSASNFDTGIGFTDGGLTIAFTLASATTYDLTITPNGSGSTSFLGRSLASGGAIDDFRAFTFNTNAPDPTDPENNFVNSLSITAAVPEPGTLALLGGGLLAVAIRRRLKA